MAKDLDFTLEIRDFVEVVLNKPLTPICVGSETELFERPGEIEKVESVIGDYVGFRPGIIKIDPKDKKLLAAPREISRYIVIDKVQIKKVHKYEKTQIFP